MSLSFITCVWYDNVDCSEMSLGIFNEILDVFFLVQVSNEACNLAFSCAESWK